MASALLVGVVAPSVMAALSLPRVSITINEDEVGTGNVLTGTSGLTVYQYTSLLAGQGAGTLTIVTAVGGTNGNYTYTPPADWSGTKSGQAWYYATDGSASNFAAIDITVTSVNDAPSFTKGASQDVLENSGLHTVSGWATDLNKGATNESAQTLSFTVRNDNNDLFSGQPAISPTGTLTFTPAADMFGSATVYAKIVDSGSNVAPNVNESAEQSFTITVGNVNAAPDFTAGTDVTVDEDSGDYSAAWASGITAGVNEDGSQTVDFVIDSVSDTSLFAAGPEIAADGTLTFTPAENANGSADVTTYLHDNGGTDNGGANTSAPATFTITINAVNDAPVAQNDNCAAAENGPQVSCAVLVNDTDIDLDPLTVTAAHLDSGSGTVSFTASAVKYTPADLFVGDAVITYTVSDGTATDTAILTVTVSSDTVDPVPATPTLAFGSGRVDETAPLLISWSATDIGGTGVASYEVQASVAGGSFATIYTGTGTSITKFYPFGKNLVFRVRATDRAANVSDWVATATRKLVAYQSTGITYKGAWYDVASAASSGTGYRYTLTATKWAKVTFTGKAVLYVAPKLASAGYVKVYVDGALVGRYNLHTSKTALGQIIARASWGTSGSHTIKIVNDQGGRRTALDAFIVLQ